MAYMFWGDVKGEAERRNLLREIEGWSHKEVWRLSSKGVEILLLHFVDSTSVAFHARRNKQMSKQMVYRIRHKETGEYISLGTHYAWHRVGTVFTSRQEVQVFLESQLKWEHSDMLLWEVEQYALQKTSDSKPAMGILRALGDARAKYL